MARTIKQLWFDESFFIKIKTEASERNEKILDYTRMLGRKKDKKKDGLFPKLTQK